MRANVVKGLILGGVIGIACGVGGYTFIYAKGASYLTDNPQSCANCHIMQDHYDAWVKSSHRSVATCNDCHTPHTLVGKYLTKADNGFWHSFAFTTGQFREPIQIKERNRKITESACLDCHKQIVADIIAAPQGPHTSTTISCIRCHRDVGHAHH